MKKNSLYSLLTKLIASGFGSGLSKRAPGTIGSLCAWIVLVLVYQATVFELISSRILVAIFITFVGCWATRHQLLDLKSDKDPQWIVIDEWAGVAIALAPATTHHSSEFLIALVAFRFFDITKLGPIGWAEKLPRWMGVMADDIVAGCLAAACVWASKSF